MREEEEEREKGEEKERPKMTEKGREKEREEKNIDGRTKDGGRERKGDGAEACIPRDQGKGATERGRKANEKRILPHQSWPFFASSLPARRNRGGIFVPNAPCFRRGIILAAPTC